MIEKPREQSLQQIFSLKRDLIAMRRVITPMRDFFARDSDEISHLPGMDPMTSLTSVTSTTRWCAPRTWSTPIAIC